MQEHFNEIVNWFNEAKYAAGKDPQNPIYVREFKNSLKFFFGEDLSERLFDVMYHDAFDFFAFDERDLTAESVRDGMGEAGIYRDLDHKDSNCGIITKTTLTVGCQSAHNLLIIKDDVTKSYKIADDKQSVSLQMTIGEDTYKKVTLVDDYNNISYEVYKVLDNKCEVLLFEGNEFSIKDAINIYLAQTGDKNIDTLFTEITRRYDIDETKRTRK